MFERFTTDARDVVRLAQDQARGLQHDHIGTEHLLLALAAKRDLPAAGALASLGADETALRAAVERAFPRGTQSKSAGQIPFTPEAKKALELSLREALALGHNYIGAEHLLLGLVRVDDGAAATVLSTLGIGGARVREAVVPLMPAPRDPRRGIRRRAAGSSLVDWGAVPTAAGWEYRIELPPSPLTAEWLNALGAERWELVGPTPTDLGDGLIFKRRGPHVYRQAEPPEAETGASTG
jgi:hypothetical protein